MNLEAPIEQQDNFVFVRRTIENGGKFKITEFIVLEGTPPEDFPRFKGAVQGQIGAHPNGQPIIGFKEFEIHADTGTEAFRQLPDLLKTAIDGLNRDAPRLVEEALEAAKPKPQLVLANQLPQIDNGEVRMQFAQPAARSSKQRPRRSR